MKKRITKILGVVLSLALLSSLAIVAAPVTAAPGLNTWGAITLPPVMENSDVDLIAVAADGTLFASVYKYSALGDDYIIYKSTDGGWKWKATEFTSDVEVTAIVCAPNWGENDTFYVGDDDGQVYRCTDAGDAEPVLLRQIVDSTTAPAGHVYDMDLWTDGGSIWIMVATEIDVLVMEDSLFAEWIDMDLTISFDTTPQHYSQNGNPHDDFDRAFVCRFAPDFDQSGLIWTILRDQQDDAWISATISPGQWGQVVNSVQVVSTDELRDEIDLDFADYYSSTSAPILFAALNFRYGPDGDDVYLIEGAFGMDASIATPLEFSLGAGVDPCSIEVSGEVIMVGDRWDADVWISRNGGDTFNQAIKPPTGTEKTQVLMAPGVFDPANGIAYAATQGRESAFSYTMDGGDTWNQTYFVDTEIDAVLDIAFLPMTASQPAVLLTDNTSAGDLGWPNAESVWRTGDITADSPTWERVYCTTHSDNWNDDFELVGYAMDSSVLMLSIDVDGDNKIIKSTDNGQKWSAWRTLPSAMGDINDWVIYDSATVFAACDGGFYGTTRFGPAKQRLTTEALASIALQPGFDPNDPENSTVIVGNDAMFDDGPDPDVYHGRIFVSTDGGNNWGDANAVATKTVDFCVLVAFDQLDPSVVYYSTTASEVGTAVIDGDELDDMAALEDSEEDTAVADSFTGLWVAPDNALYALGANTYPSTQHDLDADGSFVVADADPTAAGSIQVQQDVGFNPSGSITVAATDITTIFGTFINGEALLVIGSNLVFSTGSVSGTIQVQGNTSGASGQVAVSGAVTGPFWFEGATCSVTSSILNASLNVDTITVASADILDTFTDGEILNITAWSLAGITGGFVSGTITIQGATSSVTDTITITSEGAGGIFETGETINVVSDSLNADDVTSAGTATADAYLFRLLLGEDGNIWETEQLNGAMGLWGFSGSNFLLSVVDSSDTDLLPEKLYGLEDSLSGQVKGVTVSKIGEGEATVSWTAMTGAELYEIVYDSEDPVFTNKTSKKLEDLDDNEIYTVKVRVATDEDFQSRWSAGVSFTTLQTICQPDNVVPGQGMQNAPLLPSFVWEDTCGNAVSYEFQLSTDPAFGTLLVDITTENTAYTLTTELAYDTNHYWRVRAISDTGTKSSWCFSNFHTRMEEIPPVTVEPPPTPTIILPAPQVTVVPPDVDITLPAPQVTVVPPAITVDVPPVVTVTQQPVPTLELPEREDPGTPVYIWVIVGIGAVLTIAVIVLIIRTRRVV